MLVMMAGGVLVVPCAASAGLLVVTALVIVFQSRLEEQHLTALHGDAYRAWAGRVGRFCPGIGRLR
jgi:protein-S-isoprenylcysteine O-methyltransferase Ste14